MTALSPTIPVSFSARLIRRKRALADGEPSRAAVDAVLATTVNGIAQGYRNTG